MHRSIFFAAFLGLLPAGFALAQVCVPTAERDALRQIAQCLAGGDCRGRTVTARENLGPGCEREIEVWARAGSARSATIRDLKMCHSQRRTPPDPAFVHGLLLPLVPLCGVEDPALYDGSAGRELWADAWAAAGGRLPEGEIVLAINPPTLRSLNHLHIHILRGNGVPFPAGATIALDDLGQVWQRAAAFAADKPAMANRNFGIAVRRRGAGFEMLVEPGAPARLRNPEHVYGIATD